MVGRYGISPTHVATTVYHPDNFILYSSVYFTKERKQRDNNNDNDWNFLSGDSKYKPQDQQLLFASLILSRQT